MTGGPLTVDLVELRRHTGSQRDVTTTVRLDDLRVGDMAVVDGEIEVALVIEAVTEGVVAHGALGLVTRGPCRRCLTDVDTPVEVVVHEIFEDRPTEGETWPIDDETIDLGPVLREAALLALPLAPLCRDDCGGPDPDRFPTETTSDDDPGRDPRWAALDDLELE